MQFIPIAHHTHLYIFRWRWPENFCTLSTVRDFSHYMPRNFCHAFYNPLQYRHIFFILQYHQIDMYTNISLLKWRSDFVHASVHDDVIKWKHFPRYRPFVQGIHRLPVSSLHKGQWRGALMLRPNKRLSKHMWGCWFETDAIVPIMASL